MKIGIVTFYCTSNYGAVLQAYALKSFLQLRGHDVFFLKTKCTFMQPVNFFRVFYSRNLGSLLNKIQRNRNLYAVGKFADLHLESQELGTDNEVDGKAKCDAYIVGSDQMWNPAWCIPWAHIVFLEFAPETAKRIAYAVSFGGSEWPSTREHKLKKLLTKFDAISVRELSGVELIKKIAHKEAKYLPDPTLLHDASFYRSLTSEVVHEKRHQYIFQYILPHETKDVALIVDFIKSTLRIQNIETHLDHGCRNWLLKNKYVSLVTWINKIKDSSFVVTNSFHGTIFALIFRKPFVTILLSGKSSLMNERVICLLTFFGLEKRVVHGFNESQITACLAMKINWVEIEKLLNEWRKSTDSFFETQGL